MKKQWLFGLLTASAMISAGLVACGSGDIAEPGDFDEAFLAGVAEESGPIAGIIADACSSADCSMDAIPTPASSSSVAAPTSSSSEAGSSTTDPGTMPGGSTTDPGTTPGGTTTDPGTTPGGTTTDPIVSSSSIGGVTPGPVESSSSIGGGTTPDPVESSSSSTPVVNPPESSSSTPTPSGDAIVVDGNGTTIPAGTHTINCSGGGQLGCWSSAGGSIEVNGAACAVAGGKGWGACGTGTCTSGVVLTTSADIECAGMW